MKKKIFSTLLLVVFAMASTSMFVSCKDYDDDINKNAKAIEELRATIKDLEGKLSDCKATCAAAHATFATKGELEALQEEIANLVTQEKLENAIKEAQDALQALLDGKASQSDLDALRTLVDGIDSKIADHLKDYAKTSDVEAVKSDLNRQMEIINLYLNELKEQLGVTDDQAAIDKLLEMIETAKAALSKVGSYPADDLTSDEIAQLRKIMEDYNKEINDNGFVNLNTLQKFLDKMVGSLVLKSDFRVLGVQAIEVPALVLQPTLRLVNPKDDETKELTEKETWNYIHLNAETGQEYLAGAYDGEAPIWVEFDPSTHYSEVRNDPWGYLTNYLKEKKSDFVFYNNFEVPAKATYHINPSTANIDGANLRFYTNTELVVEEIESRDTRFEEGANSNFAIASPSVVGKTADVVKDGLLSVNVTLKNWKEYVKFLVQNADGNYIKNKWGIEGYGLNGSEEFSTLTDSINFIALQLQKGDTTVTSGYAAVAPALYHITNLADNAPEVAMPSYLDCGNKVGWTGKNGFGAHMYKTAADAIAHPATHTVPYDGSIDLAEFVETHYTYLGAKTAWYNYDHTMTAEVFNQLGLKYHYEVISYTPTTGANATDQKEHIQHYDSNPSVFYPRSVVYETGKMIADQVAKEGAIGKEPVIRVTLENAKGDVFEIGYVKLRIGGKEVVESVNMTVLDDVYVDCATDAKLFWHQIESKINDDLHISKANFEAEYEVDGILNYGGTTGFDDLFNRFWVLDGKYVTQADYISYLKQQLAAGIISKAEYDKLYAKATVGNVFNTVTDAAAKQNNVIYWRFATDADYENLKLAAGISTASKGISTEDIEAYVRFKNKVEADNYIYVKITIPAGKLHMAYGKIGKKDLSQWHQQWSHLFAQNNDGSDAAEVHMTVPAPQERNKAALTSDLFRKDLNTYFLGAKPEIEGIDYEKFTKFRDAEVVYTFTYPADAQLAPNATKAEIESGSAYYWMVYGNQRVNGKNVMYKIHTTNYGAQIVAVARYEWDPSKGVYNEYGVSAADGLVVYFDNSDNLSTSIGNTTVHYAETEVAFDILNYAGRFNGNGDDLYTTYFGKDYTFTAIVNMKMAACYDVLLENKQFVIRFVRPISLIGGEKSIQSHLNELQTIKVLDLVKIKDYRAFDAPGAATFDDGKHQVGWAYYGVTALHVDPDFIFTDHGYATKPGPYKGGQFDEIEALHHYQQVPDIVKGLDLTNVNTPASPATLGGTINYMVYSSQTDEFHIYVPVTVTYAFGTKTQLVYGKITVKVSAGQDDSGKAKKN